jgi:ribosomal protein S18 acetylase RimI-like enzyme
MEGERDLETGDIPFLMVVDDSSQRAAAHDSNSGFVVVERSTAAHEDFRFRRIHPADQAVIQALHEDWFPVRYQEDFYKELVHERMAHSGEPLFTCVAVTTRNEEVEEAENDWGLTDIDNEPQQEQQDEVIAACVVGSFLRTTQLSGKMQSLLISDRQLYKRMFYIMTLGTVDEYRQAGLGTTLIQRCMEQVEQDSSCGALYLHVITDNQAAIRFYEKLGFYRVTEISNYYSIDGKLHSCYLYAKYYHGNRGHRDPYRLLSRVLSVVWRQIKAPLSLLMDFSSVQEEDC